MNAKGDRAILETMRLLSIDALRDVEMGWVANEFQANMATHLPVGWKQLRHPDGRIHYVNDMLRIDTLENPLVPRFRKLVEYLRFCRDFGVPRDELSVLELVDPIERPADVKDMATYMGIDPWTESHLLWIAKLALLEALPEGWDEVDGEDGKAMFVHLPSGKAQDHHPLDPYFKALLDRDRSKKPPATSVQWRYYEWPVTHYRADRSPTGDQLRTRITAASGPWLDFWDPYGRRYWYHMVTGEITMDPNIFRKELAAVVIQRMFRGWRVRKTMGRVKRGVDKVSGLYLNFKYKKNVMTLEQKRERAVEIVLGHWRNHTTKIEASKELFVRLGLMGLRRPLRSLARGRVAGVLESKRSFHGVRCSVIMIQRCFRAFRARRIGQPAPRPSIVVQLCKHEWQWPSPFRDYSDPRMAASLVTAMMRHGEEAGRQVKALTDAAAREAW